MSKLYERCKNGTSQNLVGIHFLATAMADSTKFDPDNQSFEIVESAMAVSRIFIPSIDFFQNVETAMATSTNLISDNDTL